MAVSSRVPSANPLLSVESTLLSERILISAIVMRFNRTSPPLIRTGINTNEHGQKQYHAAKRSDRKDKRITAKRRKESETGGKLNASSARKISSPYRYKARPSEGHAAAKVRRDSLLRSRKVV